MYRELQKNWIDKIKTPPYLCLFILKLKDDSKKLNNNFLGVVTQKIIFFQ